jgi:type II secretory pathway component GspD/PulD (secretin)
MCASLSAEPKRESGRERWGLRLFTPGGVVMIGNAIEKSSGRRIAVALTMGLCLAASAQSPRGQGESMDVKAADVKPDVYQTFYLINLTQRNEANDLQTDLRNLFPGARLYYVASQDAISMRGTAEDIALAQKVVSDMDRPKKTYRLTYSIREIDGGKPMGTQQVVVIVAPGGKTVVKQGNRVPISTGSIDSNGGTPVAKVEYLDVGLNIDATLDGSAEGLRLRSQVEQSSVAEEKSGVGTQDPVIRQTRLDDVSTLVPGKATVLGSFDIPDTTRREEIEVVAEPMR